MYLPLTSAASEGPVTEEKSQDAPATSNPPPADGVTAASKDTLTASEALNLVDSIITSPIKPPLGAAFTSQTYGGHGEALAS